ncbi:MAG: redoxin domain-containing protein, partial [Saprospiraceae bacterium]
MYFKILFLSIVFCFNPWRYNLFGQKSIKDFALLNVDGKYIGTKDFENARGFIIIFTCNHCPFAKLYTKRINELQKKYSKHQIYLLAINSMD